MKDISSERIEAIWKHRPRHQEAGASFARDSEAVGKQDGPMTIDQTVNIRLCIRQPLQFWKALKNPGDIAEGLTALVLNWLTECKHRTHQVRVTTECLDEALTIRREELGDPIEEFARESDIGFEFVAEESREEGKAE